MDGAEGQVEAVVDPQAAPAEPVQPLEAQITQAEAQAPPAESSWTGVRDYAKAQGLDLPYEDDAAALNHLIRAQQQLQERNYYTELGQRMAPHAEAVQEFIRTRQQQAQQPASPPWAPPVFDRRWLQQVERDEATGSLRAKAGYDPQVADKVNAYAEWRDKFLEDPAGVMAPLVEDRAREIVRQEQARYQQDVTASQLVRQNSGWMFASDQEGRLVTDARGQRQLTPAGVHYARAAKDLWDSGMRDVERINAYAVESTRAQALLARYQAERGQPAPVVSNGSSVPGGSVSPISVGGAQTRPAAGLNQPAAQQAGLSLQEMLKRNLDNAGVPDDVMF